MRYSAISCEANIKNLKDKIIQLAQRYERDPNEIQLIAVSKFQPKQSIEAAYAYGLRDFGENYIQEWQQKSQQLSHLKDIRWHIIGNIQSNKVKFLNENTFCVQSLSSLSLAKELEKKRSGEKPLKVLIQLQVDPNDTNKSGIPFDKMEELSTFILNSKKLNLCGFMGIGPENCEKQKLKDTYFEFVNKAKNSWNSFANKKNTSAIISLGMSQDLEIAIECGSNMVRVGTAIFGKRNAQSS